MCGIFGIIAYEDDSFPNNLLKKALSGLATLSESRGKESSGFASIETATGQLRVIKGAVPVSLMLRTSEFRKFIKSNNGQPKGHHTNLFAVMGHARLVTNGSMLKDNNNQPVIRNGLVGIHNGIIVNDEVLWQKHTALARYYEIDTEVMLALIQEKIRNGLGAAAAVSHAVDEVFGTVSLALMFADRPEFVITTNNGSLYWLNEPGRLFLFASEGYILKRVVAEKFPNLSLSEFGITQVSPRTGILLNLESLIGNSFSYEKALVEPDGKGKRFGQPLSVAWSSVSTPGTQLETLIDMATIQTNPRAGSEKKLLEYNWDRISRLQRCRRCLLPETFPFISFDEKGVCNLCNNYRPKNQPKPIEELYRLVEPYRGNSNGPNCIVPYSGGRDSTYALHIVKKILKLNPLAFTYDWGMVTDLARRNIARVCGRLGVENIIVSADIRWKRSNIRKNILAWLKRPDLGLVPLFMAGDKYFFYYTDQLKKQTGIELNIWGINPLENTDFKVGFCGVPLDFNKERIYSMQITNQVKLFRHILKNVILNPAYLNESVFDTLGSFAVRYITPRKNYYHMFDYYRWDESEIEDLIINEYEWETAIDTTTTWRIGDGTAAFYNYIYFNVAGFSEHDTFRSNQIREGMITREQGMRSIESDNRPRYESIKWYCDIIGLDYESTIKRINAIPKLY
jgi:glucosamine--fructose-6-phosphate aminotransferase (isomerizing)